MKLTYLKKDFDMRSLVPIVSPSPPMATRSSSNGKRRTQLENLDRVACGRQLAPHGIEGAAKHQLPTTDAVEQQGRKARLSK